VRVTHLVLPTFLPSQTSSDKLSVRLASLRHTQNNYRAGISNTRRSSNINNLMFQILELIEVYRIGSKDNNVLVKCPSCLSLAYP
jgi:hypothetical protein